MSVSSASTPEGKARRNDARGRLPAAPATREQPQGFAARVSDRNAVIAVGLLLACILGLALLHHGLASYDPSLGFKHRLSTTENIFFAPSGSSRTLNLCIIACLLFARRLHIWRALRQPPSLGLAIPLLSAGLGLAYWSYFTAAPDLLIPALMLTVLGLAALLGGRAAARVIWLPTFFLVFNLMRPGVLVNAVVYPLQMLTAETATWVLNAIGSDAQRFEDLIVTQGRVFQVIETCSGMRIIETLFMASLLYVDIFYRHPRQVVLLILFSPVIGLLCNTLRVVTIILNRYSAAVEVHSTQGVVVLVVGVLMIAGLDSVVRRYLEPRKTRWRRSHSSPIPSGLAESLLSRRLAVGAALLIAFGCGTWTIDAYAPPRERWPMVSLLPAQLGHWKTAKNLKFEEQFMGSVRATDWTRRRYVLDDNDAESVEVFIATDERRNRRVSLRSPKTQRLDAGVSVVNRRPLLLAGAQGPIDQLLLTGVKERWLALYWERGWDPFGVEAAHAILALDQSPLRRPGRGIVVQIRTPTGRTEEDVRASETRLERFLADFRADFAKLEIPIGAEASGLAELHVSESAL